MEHLRCSPEEVSRKQLGLPRSSLNYPSAIRGDDQPVAGADVDLLEHGGLSLVFHRVAGHDLAASRSTPACTRLPGPSSGHWSPVGPRLRPLGEGFWPPCELNTSLYPAPRSIVWTLVTGRAKTTADGGSDPAALRAQHQLVPGSQVHRLDIGHRSGQDYGSWGKDLAALRA